MQDITKPRWKGGSLGLWFACNTKLFPKNRKKILLICEMVAQDPGFNISREARIAMNKIKKAILKRESL